MTLGALKRVAAVSAQSRRNETIEIIEQHVIRVVVLTFGIAIDHLARTKTGTGIIRLAVTPVKDAAIVVRHHPLVRLTDEGLRAFRGKEAPCPRGRGIVRDDTADPDDRIVELRFGGGVVARAQSRGATPIIA